MKKAGVPDDAKAAMKAAGTWEDFKMCRARLKAEGVPPAEAKRQALATYNVAPLPKFDTSAKMPSKPKGFSEGVIDSFISQIPEIPPELADKQASESDCIRWIYNHITPGTDLSDCPSPGAWLEVHICRMSPTYLIDFLKGPRAKLIPAKAQLDSGNDKDIDGKPSLDLIDRIKNFRLTQEDDE